MLEQMQQELRVGVQRNVQCSLYSRNDNEVEVSLLKGAVDTNFTIVCISS